MKKDVKYLPSRNRSFYSKSVYRDHSRISLESSQNDEVSGIYGVDKNKFRKSQVMKKKKNRGIRQSGRNKNISSRHIWEVDSRKYSLKVYHMESKKKEKTIVHHEPKDQKIDINEKRSTLATMDKNLSKSENENNSYFDSPLKQSKSLLVDDYPKSDPYEENLEMNSIPEKNVEIENQPDKEIEGYGLQSEKMEDIEKKVKNFQEQTGEKLKRMSSSSREPTFRKKKSEKSVKIEEEIEVKILVKKIFIL